MAISFTQSRSSFAAGVTSLGLAFSSNVSSSNPCLIVGVRDGFNSGDTITVSDNVNAGNYAADVTANIATDGDTCGIRSKANAASGATTVTATIGGTGSICLAIHEYAGIATSTPFDKSASANSTSTSPNSGNTATTTQASELVFGFVGNSAANTITITSAGGATQRELITNTGNSHQAAASNDLIVSSTGAQSASFSFTVSEEWTCLCATYKAAAGASAPFTPVNDDGQAFRKGQALDFYPPNLLAQQTLKLPPFIQKELPGWAIRAKGNYTDFNPPNLLADQILKLPPFTQENEGARTFWRGVYTDFTPPTLILSTLIPTPAPLLPQDLSQQVKARWAGSDFITQNLLTGHLPSPPVAPVDATISIRAKGVFTDFSPPNLALSTLVPIAPATPQDISGIRLEYRWIRGDDLPVNLLPLKLATVTPIAPQDLSGIRLDARGLRSDFTPPNLTLFLPVPPPIPLAVPAGRHGSRIQARRRRQLDVLRAKLEAFKEQKADADRALMALEDRELAARAKLLKRIRVKPLTKPLEQYAPIKNAVAQRTVATERHRSILEQIRAHQLEAERIEREIESERDEEAALHLMHFLMMETAWYE